MSDSIFKKIFIWSVVEIYNVCQYVVPCLFKVYGPCSYHNNEFCEVSSKTLVTLSLLFFFRLLLSLLLLMTMMLLLVLFFLSSKQIARKSEHWKKNNFRAIDGQSDQSKTHSISRIWQLNSLHFCTKVDQWRVCASLLSQECECNKSWSDSIKLTKRFIDQFEALPEWRRKRTHQNLSKTL